MMTIEDRLLSFWNVSVASLGGRPHALDGHLAQRPGGLSGPGAAEWGEEASGDRRPRR